MQNIPRILQNYLNFNAFFSKILEKSQENLKKSQKNFSKKSGKGQENFEKSQENFRKKSGKFSQLDLWQP